MNYLSFKLSIKYFFAFLANRSTGLKNDIEKLADLLNICKHPDHTITLEAISKFVLNRLNKHVIEDPSTVLPKVNIDTRTAKLYFQYINKIC